MAARSQGSTGGSGGRRWTERLLGGAAREPAARPARPSAAAPRSVRLAALLVALEALALVGVAVVLGWLTVTSTADDVGRAVAEVVYVLLGAAALGACAVGLRRVAGWAQGPVVVLQVLLGLLGYVTAFEGGQPLLGLPVLACVAGVCWFLATPEARLAYSGR
ncbi:hypothetical protein TEK04_09795 [Klenkia sp. LSe6-5]|uniref:Integral membrane protein n=1 Tax=Klenkia sesuvii TaxID=3103137 RepID=A0ABU8DT41_9ACTN